MNTATNYTDYLMNEDIPNRSQASSVVRTLCRLFEGPQAVFDDVEVPLNECITVGNIWMDRVQAGITDAHHLRHLTTRVAGVGALLTLFRLANPAKAESFVEGLRTGLGFDGESDPRYLLRERLISIQSHATPRPTTFMLMHMFIRAWNAYTSGDSVAIITRTKDRTFPDINGWVPWSTVTTLAKVTNPGLRARMLLTGEVA